jgi:hypothetical protein
LEQKGGFKMSLDVDKSVEIVIIAFIKGMKDL